MPPSMPPQTTPTDRRIWQSHGVFGFQLFGSVEFEQSLEELAENSKQSWGGVSPCPSQIQELSRLVVHLPDRAEAAARRVSSPPQRPKNKQEVEEPPYP